MRSDARKRAIDALRADLVKPPADTTHAYTNGFNHGYDEAIDRLRAIVNARSKPHGGWPQLIAVSDLYTLIGDPTTWTPDGAA